MRFNQIRRPDWTDLAVALGPDTRWVEAAYDDLARFAPEVLLGYRVRLATPTTRLQGFMIRKLILLEGLDHGNRLHCGSIQQAVAITRSLGGKVEWWHVHRPDPIARVA